MLETVPLFEDLPEESLASLKKEAITRRFPKNTILISEGDTTDSMYIIQEGRVKIYLSNERDKEIIINFLGAGEYFGEMALLDSGVRSANVMAVEPSTCLVIRRPVLESVLRENPAIALQMIKVLAQRNRELSQQVKDLALAEVYERMARLFTKLAIEDGEAIHIPQKLTQQDIANMIGSSREMVSKLFKDLTQGGYLQVDRGAITILKRLPDRW